MSSISNGTSDRFAHWIYPRSDDYGIREYQREICSTALYNNTLVCLPTGLGKTLIAAVVMYNYYKWFPGNQVIFLAPTKPLVAQQIKACYYIMGVDEKNTAHLEGTVSQDEREFLWRTKRLFFSTPQTVENDLNRGVMDAKRIVCLVIDEAHRATGSYSYAVLLQRIWSINPRFRILALSATPGGDFRKIQNLIQTLKIARIEIRTEDDPEVAPYCFEKQVEIIKCKSGVDGGLEVLRNMTNDLMKSAVMRLYGARLLSTNQPKLLNIMVVDEAQRMKHRSSRDVISDEQDQQELEDLSMLRLLIRCRKAINDDDQAAAVSMLMDTATSKHVPFLQQLFHHKPQLKHAFARYIESLKRSSRDKQFLEKRQPKLMILRSLIAEHFIRHLRSASSTRVIIFAELRSTVHDIVEDLKALSSDATLNLPDHMIRPHIFVGQATTSFSSNHNNHDDADSRPGSSRGLKQREQQEVLTKFRQGDINVLVATSIAEEGLDIEEVDLLVLFDTVASPGRMMQRMGRTGRKRSGRVVLLVIEGKDEDKVEKANESLQSIQQILRDPVYRAKLRLCDRENENARMIPDHMPVPTIMYQDMDVKAFDGKLIQGSRWHADQASDHNSSSTSMAMNKNICIERFLSNKPPHAIINSPHHNYHDDGVIVIDDADVGLSLDNSVSILEVIDHHVEVADDKSSMISTTNINPNMSSNNHHTVAVAPTTAAALNRMRLSWQRSSAMEQPSSTSMPSHIDRDNLSQHDSLPLPVPTHNPHGSSTMMHDHHGADLSFGQLYEQGHASPSPSYRHDMSKRVMRYRCTRYDKLVDSLQSSAKRVWSMDRDDARMMVERIDAMKASLLATRHTSDDMHIKSSAASSTASSICAEPSSSPPALSSTSSSSYDAERLLSSSSTPASQPSSISSSNISSTTSSMISNHYHNDQHRIISSMHVSSTCTYAIERAAVHETGIGSEAASSDQRDGIGVNVGSSHIIRRNANAYARFILVDSSDDDDDDEMVTSRHEKAAMVDANREPMHVYDSIEPHQHHQTSASLGVDDADMKQQDDVDDNVDEILLTSTQTNSKYDADDVGKCNSSHHHDDDVMHDVITSSMMLHEDHDVMHDVISSDDKVIAPVIINHASSSHQHKRPRRKPLNLPAPVPLHHDIHDHHLIDTTTNIHVHARDGIDHHINDHDILKGDDHHIEADDEVIWDDDVDEEDDGNGMPCCVCLQTGSLGDDDPLIICQGSCMMQVHASCYGGDHHLLSSSSSFVCDACAYNMHRPSYAIHVSRCHLCQRTDGMMKKIKPHQFSSSSSGHDMMTHLSCVLFCAELTVDDAMRPDNIHHLDRERASLFCEVCRGRGGGIVQCADKKCMTAAHPHCAMKSGMWTLLIQDTSSSSKHHDDDDHGMMRYDMYCSSHRKRAERDDDRRFVIVGIWRANDQQLRLLSSKHHISSSSSSLSSKPSSSAVVIKHMVKPKQHVHIDDDSFLELDTPAKPKHQLSRLRRQGEHAGASVREDHYHHHTADKHKLSKKKKSYHHVRRYFDEEAALSGSDDDDDDDDHDDDDGVLSGDFINDGDYTQASGASPGLALYRSVDRRKLELESPCYDDHGYDKTPIIKFRGAEKGLPIIAAILRRKRKRQAKQLELVSSNHHDDDDDDDSDGTAVSVSDHDDDHHDPRKPIIIADTSDDDDDDDTSSDEESSIWKQYQASTQAKDYDSDSDRDSEHQAPKKQDSMMPSYARGDAHLHVQSLLDDDDTW